MADNDTNLTTRQKVVLAALASAQNASFAPVQVQKLFFLIDENVSELLGSKQFNFQPYNYGPFDVEVYRDLEALSAHGFVEILSGAGRNRIYRLTSPGQALGLKLRSDIHAVAADYFTRAAEWVKAQNFAELVGSIYKAYPRMKEKSIFVG